MERGFECDWRTVEKFERVGGIETVLVRRGNVWKSQFERAHSRESTVVSFSPGEKKSQMTRRSRGRKLEDTPSMRQ